MTAHQCWMNKFDVEELDRNPTEHLWDTLEMSLQAMPSHPTSVSDLTNVLLEEWSEIPINKPFVKPSQKG